MRLQNLILISLVAALAQGCATTVTNDSGQVVHASRTLGAKIDDNNIEIKATLAISGNDSLSNHTHLNVVSYNGNVLIVGQAPNEYLRSLASKTVAQINGVKKVHNQVRIGNTVSMLTRTNDVWLTSKVKTKLLTDESVSGHKIKVVTENGEVFLMGIVTNSDANKAVEIARNISGVARVVKVFEYI